MKKDRKETDLWVYVLLLTTLLILAKSLTSYTFKIMNVDLPFTLFILPLVFFIIDIIAKKFDYKKSVAAIAISSVVFISFCFIVAYAIDGDYILKSLMGEFCAYIVAAFTNLTIYMFLLNNTESPRLLVVINYMFTLVVYYMIYTMIHLNMIIFDEYWLGYFITLAIQLFISIGLSMIDKGVNRGQ